MIGCGGDKLTNQNLARRCAEVRREVCGGVRRCMEGCKELHGGVRRGVSLQLIRL